MREIEKLLILGEVIEKKRFITIMIFGMMEAMLGILGASVFGNELNKVISGYYNIMIGGGIYRAVLILGFLISVLTIALGIGILKMKPAALRYSLFFLLISTLIELCVIVSNHYGLISDVWMPYHIVFLIFCCFFMFYLTHPKVKEQFK